MTFWPFNILRDARRYRVLRDELTDRFVLGTTCHSPEELDERVDAELDGTLDGLLRAEDEERRQQTEEFHSRPLPPQPTMAGWQPIFPPPGTPEKVR